MNDNIAKKVMEYEEKYGLMTKGLVEAVWVVDLATMKYLYVSPTVENVIGYTPGEMIGTEIRNYLTAESYDQVVKSIVQALELFKERDDDEKERKGGSKSFDLEFVAKNGSTVWLEITARLYSEKDGSVRIISVSKNIDQRKKFDKEREELIKKLEDALSEKDRLLKENKILMGLLPICAECKKIRDDQGKWWQIEEYISSRTEAEFSHTICPECKLKLYPQFSR